MTKDFANNFHAHADFEKTTTVQVKLLQFYFLFLSRFLLFLKGLGGELCGIIGLLHICCNIHSRKSGLRE